MESWRLTLRQGLFPLLNNQHLEVLLKACCEDDPKLIQGATTTPLPLACQDWPVEAACLLGYAGWQGDNLETVGEVKSFFADLCFKIDQNMGEPASCRFLINWYDETERKEMLRELASELVVEIDRRSNETEVASESCGLKVG